MKRRAKIDIPDGLITKGKIYEFFESEGFGTGKDCRRYEIRHNEHRKSSCETEFMLENFEEIVEPVSELGLLTALKVIERSEPDDCSLCKLRIRKRKVCCLEYCLYAIARNAKNHIEAGNK
jgi:hypothetical protein